MRAAAILFFLVVCLKSFSNERLALAHQCLDRSDLTRAITLYKSLSDSSFRVTRPDLYLEAQIGLAKAYTDLGVYHLSIKTIENSLSFLESCESSDYATFGRLHLLLADNYDHLFLLEDFMRHTNHFIDYYRRSQPDSEIFEALYHAYLGRYYNLTFAIDQAYQNTSRALELFYQSKSYSDDIEFYKIYESHCFTLRNYSDSEREKQLYVDTLKLVVNEQLLKRNIQRAKALISISSADLDHAFNTLINPESELSPEAKEQFIEDATKNYKEGIAIFKELGFENHDYLSRYYDLQAWIYFAGQDYQKAMGLLKKGIDSYALLDFLDQGFVPNNYRLATSLRFKVLILAQIQERLPDTGSAKDYLGTLEILERLWENHFLERVRSSSDFVSNMYNQHPYQFLFEYYAERYMENGELDFLEKAHEYDEKSRYSGLLSTLALSEEQIFERQNLLREKQRINLLLDQCCESVFLNSADAEEINVQAERAIHLFEEQKSRSGFGAALRVQSIDAIQSQLAVDEALVSYNFVGLGRDRLYAKVVSNERVSLHLLSCSDSSYSENYRQVADSIQIALKKHDVETFKELSLRIYHALFEPLQNHLGAQVRKVRILPFADIETLPFDLLITEESDSKDFRRLPYLARSYCFSYELSTSIDRLNEQSQTEHPKELSIYKPNFANTSQARLEYASEIANELSSQWYSELYTHEDASIENFKKSLANSKIVLLISHGESTQAMSSVDKGVHLQDGFLSMKDVYESDVNCDFLVLTACESGGGLLDRGEGNIGLVRAFTSAGARSILVANWKIDEKTSLGILNRVFHYLGKGLDRSESLNRAKLEFLETCIPREGNPLFWAGMNLVGDAAPLSLQPRSESKVHEWLWYLAFILAIPVLILFRRPHS